MKSKARSFGMPALAIVPVTFLAFAAIPRGDAVRSGQEVCTLTPDSVAISEQPVTVSYTAPDTLGMITSVTAPEDSGIRVTSVDNQAKTISLNTSSAAEGDWQLTLQAAEQRSCTANLKVKAAGGF